MQGTVLGDRYTVGRKNSYSPSAILTVALTRRGSSLAGATMGTRTVVTWPGGRLGNGIERDACQSSSPDRRIMAAMLSAVDDSVGAIVDELKRQGRYGNTCFFFQSDNGPSREPCNWLDGRLDRFYGGSSGPLKGNKFSLYEGGIRSPALMCWPDGIPGGRVVCHPGVGMDIFPTFLSAVGGDPSARAGWRARRHRSLHPDMPAGSGYRGSAGPQRGPGRLDQRRLRPARPTVHQYATDQCVDGPDRARPRRRLRRRALRAALPARIGGGRNRWQRRFTARLDHSALPTSRPPWLDSQQRPRSRARRFSAPVA